MRRWLIIIVVSMLVGISAGAQTTYSIKGKVIEKQTGEAVIGAAIRVLAVPDSTFVKGASTGTTGRYDITGIKDGKYILHVAFMGMSPVYHNISVNGSDLEMGSIELEEAVTRLDVVEVTAQANPVTVKQDTIQFNASAFKTRQGANLEELLRRIPGMEVDDEGKISYNGEAIERIEMDGRDFFSNDPQMATRNLPSDMIKNLQVVDKKSEETRLTGMNDGDKVKVLNLEIKEDKKKGVITNATAGYGTMERYRTNLLMNIFNKDARYTIIGELNNTDGVQRGRGDRVTRRIGTNYDNVFLNKTLKVTAEASLDSRDNINSGRVRTEQLLGGESRNVENEQSYSFNRNQRAGANSRIEWNPSKKTMLIFEPSVQFNWGNSNGNTSFETVNNLGSQINEGTSVTSSKSQGYDLNARLHFSQTFNDLGRNLYTQFFTNYSDNRGDGFNNSVTRFFNGNTDQLMDQYNDNFSNSFRISSRVSYLEPFNKRWALQVGYHLDYNKRESNQSTYNKDAGGLYTLLDTDYSRGSQNTSLTQQIQTRLRYSFGKSSISAGFSANPTYTHTVSSQGGVVNFDKERTVWNYSPSVIMDIRPTDSLTFNLFYNGRTSQPTMEQLNPATIILSPLAQVKGNPDLLPSFSHNVWVNTNFNRRSARQTFSLNGGWSYTQNGVASKQTIDPATGVRITTYDNIDGNQSLRAGFMINTPIGGARSKWTSFTFGHLMYSKDKGFVNGELNTADVWQPNLSQRISWNGSWVQATVGGFLAVQDVTNSFSTQLDRRTWDYNTYGEAIFTIPGNISLNTKLTYQDAKGYDDGIKRNFWLWDTSISWSFLKGKNATIELSAYDILQQRTNFQRRITANSIVDREYNGITSYVMLSFTYRFNNMGGGVVASDPSQPRRGFGPGGGRGRF